MIRILWVLPLCLILQDQQKSRNAGKTMPIKDEPVSPIVCEVVASLPSFPAMPIPASVAWPWYQIGKKEIKKDEKSLFDRPTLFIQACLDKYDKEVNGYTVLFCKHEKVKGELRKKERIFVSFKENPYRVRFEWQEGMGLAAKVLYVEGENAGKMKALPIGCDKLPFGWFRDKSIQDEDPSGPRAKQSSRYTIKEFGFKVAMEDTLRSMKRAEAKNSLKVVYEGQVPVDKLGGRMCHKFVRKPYTPVENEEEKLNELILYYDVDNWLQVGSELRDINGDFIAEYYFRDLQLNPTFTENPFSPKAL